MNKIALTNLSVLPSERKKKRTTSRTHRRSGTNDFYNGLGGQLLDRNMVNERLGNVLFGSVMPSQLIWHDPKPGPEKLLMLAVLHGAIMEHQKYRDKVGRRRMRLWREADLWIRSAEVVWPFSFINICFALGMDPDYVRAGIFAWRRAA